MRPTCEIMVQRVLPAIRAEVARTMMIEFGCTQQRVAEVLGLSRAAVSQYVSEKRGADVGFSVETLAQIQIFAEELLEDLTPREKVAKMCEVCKQVQKSGWLYKNAPGAEYCFLCGEEDA
ncbi:putative transcriptional regulator [Methanohalophilus levihalophilus]|uniref:transcriptional regulator n=1 Tax=Methanohalophilus levihalophilus TaxID=1431282 RepID=UPI001AE73884|nr:transcriptional regulator [Methanohalophilus levihalophilus]MBP2030134.1 putative transcriptional regulator [Methanohalophilus levihalophilus]